MSTRRLSIDSTDPIRIKKWLRNGEFEVSPDMDVQDLYDQSDDILDNTDSVGECVFQGDDGEWYVGTVEFHIEQIHPAYLAALQAEDGGEDG